MRFATLLFIFGTLLWDVSFSIAATNSPKQSMLFIDVDGTLYDDKCGIEQQVRARYKSFLNQRQLLRVVGVAEMRRNYGSVIRGLVQESGNASLFEKYYESIYPNLDMTRLHKYNQHMPLGKSGYEHTNHHVTLQALNQIRNTSIVIASNAPEFHVRSVLRKLGLANLPIVSMLTPDKLN
jgi:FMN phosphatase YigB (HAD superfamily)